MVDTTGKCIDEAAWTNMKIFFLKQVLTDFKERGRGEKEGGREGGERERERERNIDAREKYESAASHTHPKTTS